MTNLSKEVNTATLKTNSRQPSLINFTMVAITLVILMNNVQARTASILVDNSPIKPEQVNQVHLEVLDKMEQGLNDRISSYEAFSQATQDEKERLLKCQEVACQIDEIKHSYNARKTYAKSLSTHRNVFLKLETDDFKYLANSAEKKADNYYQQFEKNRTAFVNEFKKVLPTIKGLQADAENIDELSKKLTSDQRTKLLIFGSSFQKNLMLLQQRQANIQSLDAVTHMFEDKKEFLHEYTNQLSVQISQLNDYAEIQEGQVDQLVISRTASVFDTGLEGIFGRLEKSNSSKMPFLPELISYSYKKKLPNQAEKDNSGLSFLSNGSLEAIDQIVNWSRK